MKVISGYKIHESITTGGHEEVWCFECSFELCSNTFTLLRAQLGGMPQETLTALRLLRADHSEWYDTAEVRRRGLSGSQCGLEHQYTRTFAHTGSLKNLFHLKKLIIFTNLHFLLNMKKARVGKRGLESSRVDIFRAERSSLARLDASLIYIYIYIYIYIVFIRKNM